MLQTTPQRMKKPTCVEWRFKAGESLRLLGANSPTSKALLDPVEAA